MSMSPARSFASSGSVWYSYSMSLTRGSARFSRPTMWGSRYGPTVGISAIFNAPASGSRSVFASSTIASDSCRIRRARSTIRAPVGVSATRLGCRSNSDTPRYSSSLRICDDSVGWLTKQRSAALPKWRSSASATR
jgi:hypothetical protein